MLISGINNAFIDLARRLGIEVQLSGKDLVFNSREACIEHHA
jgi:hypothetical protein